jgi:integrase
MTRRRSQGSVTQKRGLWYAILTLDRDRLGRQARHWSKGFKTRRQAEHALAQLLIEGRVAKETCHTLERVVSEYVKKDVTPKGKRSPTTTVRYRGLLANMAPLHKERVDRLDDVAIERFYQGLREGGLGQTTVHHVHNLMRAAFRWAKTLKVGLITRNPFEIYDIETPQRSKSNAQSFTIEQAQRALEYLVATKHANVLVFSLATGCRRGEACGIKWSSVDMHRRVATIRESRYQIPGEIGQKVTKAGRIREVPLNDTAIGALMAERKRQNERRVFAGDAWTESGHVFSDEFGAPLSPMAVTNAFYGVATKAGLPTTRMHDLRHTAATFILSAGGNIATASAILGHSDKSTTLRIYSHVIGGDAVRASRSIDRALASRHPSRPAIAAKKKPRRSEVLLVAPTGFEPVLPP